MLPTYATDVQVARALDVKETARNREQVERAAEAATRHVEADLRRRFYPETATFTFPPPRACGRVLFLDNDLDVDLVALTTLKVDGTAVVAADRDLLPVTGPPFSRIEFADTISFGTDRRPVELTATWGYDDRTTAAGQLENAIADASTTTVDVTDSSAIGVGSLLTVESERIVVTARAMLSTAQTLQTALTASVSNVTVSVTTGSAYHIGEVILLDSERMLVVDISGNNLTVKRAWDGTVLASHTGSTIFAPRRLTVERGQLGTTAAAHADATAVVRQVYPGPVVAYTVALGLVELLGETGGYAREIGPSGAESTPGIGLDQVRAEARRGFRRMLLG